MKLYKLGMLVGILLLLWAIQSAAQTAAGTLAGVVQDESGAVIPGVNVTISNVETGISRSAVTDAGGRYRMPSLNPGRYEVRAQITGFETGVRTGIQLTVGSELEINMILKVGQVTERTEVMAEAPLVETMSGTLSGLVDDRTIRDLPLNGRSFDQLVALDSSAPVVRIKNTGSIITGGATTTYAVHGARDQQNLFLLDGSELMGAGSRNGLPGGSLGLNMGVDAVREFSVMTSNYSAAYGKKAGAIINVATKSGTNSLHGSVFEFLRNDNLDARNFFDGPKLPEFKRNQFGGGVGGPIRKDRSFFFANYEGLRQGLGISNVQFVPSDDSWRNAVAAVKPYQKAFPAANERTFKNAAGDPTGTAEARFDSITVGNQDFYLGRYDQRLSDKDSLFARYNFAHAEVVPTSNTVLFAENSPSGAQMVTLGETRTYTSTVNSLRLGYSRANLSSDTLPTVPVDPALYFFPGAKNLGGISFSLGLSGGPQGALTGTGAGNTTQRWWVFSQLEVGDEVFVQHGPHAIQLGGQFQRIQENGSFGRNKWGNFQFNSLQSFLQGRPANFTAPDPVGGADATKAYRQSFAGLFIQDDYKLRPNLTLNLGLRWEFMTPPTEASGNRISNYHVKVINSLATYDTLPTLGSPFYASHKDNFAPRVGFAWDVKGDGKTAVRGGFGLFYDQALVEYGNYTANNAPFFGTVQVTNPPFPSGFAGGSGASQAPSPEGIDVNVDVPTRLQFNLNVQRQLTPNTVLSVGYVGSNSFHLTRQYDINTTRPDILANGDRFYSATAARVNPALGSSKYISTDVNANYHGMQTEVSQRLSHNLRYKVSFTWAKNIDNTSATGTALAAGVSPSTMQPDNLGRDRGLSSFDVRRNLVGNWTYDLPWQNSRQAVVKWIASWQISSLITISDGQPFTALTGFNNSRDRGNQVADRPNLLPGKKSNPILGGPDRYFDASVFSLPAPGFYGNLGRNTLIAPGLATVDMTLVKSVPVTETFKVDFRAEFFNILNRANFGLPNNNIFDSTRALLPTAGRITNTVTSSRQVQFGLKLLF